MTKLNIFLKSDNTFGYRPDKDSIYTAVENINHGMLSEYMDTDSLNRFGVLVSKVNDNVTGYTSNDVSYYDDILDAIFNIYYPELLSKEDDVELIFCIKSVTKGNSTIQGVFNKKKWLSPVKESEKIVEKPINLKDNEEFVKELEEVAREVHTMSIVDTSLVEPRLRKYLTEVSDDLDIFADVENVKPVEAKQILSALKSKDLPYQYTQSGDILLNPNGSVLTTTLGISEDTSSADFYQATLWYILQRYKTQDIIFIQLNSILYDILIRGLQAGLYPIEPHNNKTYVADNITYSELQENFKQCKDGECKDVRALLAVLSVIIEDNLYDYENQGIPVLTGLVSRQQVAELVEKLR